MSTNIVQTAANQSKIANEADDKPQDSAVKPKKRRRWGRIIGITLFVLIVLAVAARMALPGFLRWYVNRTLDQSFIYEGRIGEIDVHLWRGAYSINDIRLVKTTGNVPVPLYAASRLDARWRTRA